MSLTTEGMTPADIAAVTGNRGGNGGFGYGGDSTWFIIILFLFALMNGGLGSNNYGGNYGMYPWLNQSNQISNGFSEQMMNNSIMEIRSGVTALSAQLSNIGNDLQMSLMNGFNGVEQSANARQIANMQTAFGMQTSMNQGFNGLQAQLAQCCCDNRLATCQTQNIIQTEGALTRQEIDNKAQMIMDKLCQQEIDALKAQNLALQNQVNMLNLAASQVSQTGQLIADNTAQTQYIVNRVAPYPIPAYVVANPTTAATGGTAG